MQLAKIKEEAIQYGLKKGIITDEDLVNDAALEDVIIQSIATAKEMVLSKGGKLSKINYITTEIPYDASVQNNPSTQSEYQVPRAILGNYNYISSQTTKHNIRLIAGLAEYSDSIHCQIPSEVRALIQGTSLIIDGGQVKDITLYFIPYDPRECNNFNVYVDDLPADAEVISKGIQILYELNLNRVVNIVKDTNTNSSDK